MSKIPTLGAYSRFLVLEDLTIEHTARFLFAGTWRFVECEPTIVRYQKGELTLRLLPVPLGTLCLFADPSGWAFHPSTLMKLRNENKLGHPT
jgi:hypothetical protein